MGSRELVTDSRFPHDGFNVRVTPRGITVLELDYWADPAKRDPAWLEKTRKQYPTEKDWKREFARDWTTPGGDSFYPEYTLNGGLDRYGFRFPGVISGAIARGWDFGIRFPAAVWAQKSPTRRRLYVYREFMPEKDGGLPADIDVRSFRDCVRYLSGQLAAEHLGYTSALWISRILADPRLPDPPWFPGQAVAQQWLDYSGNEAAYRSDLPSEDSQAITRAAVLAEGGIDLQVHHGSVEAGEDIIRELLKIQDDGLPGILIDPSCRVLHEGLAGGISYPQPTKGDPIPTSAKKDGYYEHVHEALRRVVVNLFPVADQKALPALPPIYKGRRRTTREPDDSVGWAEDLAQRRW